MDASASTWMPSPTRRPAETLTLIFDLYKPTRSSVGADEYSLYVLSRLLEPFTRYHGNKICPDKRTNAAET